MEILKQLNNFRLKHKYYKIDKSYFRLQLKSFYKQPFYKEIKEFILLELYISQISENLTQRKIKKLLKKIKKNSKKIKKNSKKIKKNSKDVEEDSKNKEGGDVENYYEYCNFVINYYSKNYKEVLNQSKNILEKFDIYEGFLTEIIKFKNISENVTGNKSVEAVEINISYFGLNLKLNSERRHQMFLEKKLVKGSDFTSNFIFLGIQLENSLKTFEKTLNFVNDENLIERFSKNSEFCFNFQNVLKNLKIFLSFSNQNLIDTEQINSAKIDILKLESFFNVVRNCLNNIKVKNFEDFNVNFKFISKFDVPEMFENVINKILVFKNGENFLNCELLRKELNKFVDEIFSNKNFYRNNKDKIDFKKILNKESFDANDEKVPLLPELYDLPYDFI